MKYKKKFNKKGTQVKITIPEGKGFWDPEKEKRIKERTFKVVKKEEIYGLIDNNEPINLKDRYVEGFSLGEYRDLRKLSIKESVELKKFSAEGAFFEGGGDFTNAIFKEDVSFQDTTFGDGNVSFKDATFGDGNGFFWRTTFGDGDVTFSGVTFGNGYVFFSGTTFGDGNVLFWGTTFGDGDVFFWGATFGDGNVLFTNTTFGEGNVSFKDVTFGEGNVSFKDVTFGEGDVTFQDTTFGEGDVNFWNTTFGNGEVNFWNTTFGDGDVFFRGVSFGNGDVTFQDATFGNGDFTFWDTTCGEGNVSFRGATFGDGNVSFQALGVKGEWDLRVLEANIINFSDVKIYGNIDFGFSKDYVGNTYTPQVNILCLINTKLYGTIHMDYDAFDLGKTINNQEDTTHRQKRDQFRLLKENFRSLGQYEDEDKSYVQFMYHKIRAEEFELSGGFHSRFKKWLSGKEWNIKKMLGVLACSLAWISDSFVFFFKWLVYEKIGLYGTSPFRVAVSMIIVVFGFSWIYAQLPSPLAGHASPLFHSVITFLTIGYGIDYADLSSFAGKLFSGIEGFLGLFLMSYFTISFVRKVLR